MERHDSPTPLRGTKRRYKAFLEPGYNKTSTSPQTDQRWRTRLNQHIDSTQLETCSNQNSGDTEIMPAIDNDSSAAAGLLEEIENRIEYWDNESITSYSGSESDGNAVLRSEFDGDLASNSEDEFIGREADQSIDHEDTEDDGDDNDDETETGPAKDSQDFTDNTVMFEAAGLTVSNVLLMIQGLALRYHLTDEARQGVVQLTKALAGPNFVDLNISKYTISKKFDPPPDKISYTFYCKNCYQVLFGPASKGSIESVPQDGVVVCDSCRTEFEICLNSTNYFMSIDIAYQIKLMLKDSNVPSALMDNLTAVKNRLNRRENVIYDIHDGELYKNVARQTRDSRKTVLTYNFNTDGTPLFKSFKKSLWPLQLLLNDLPPKMRSKRLILAALWISESEPTPDFMNLYMSIFIEQIKAFSLTITDSTGIRTSFRLVPLCAAVDSVARPIMQNRLQFNGYFGCSWCYARGEYAERSMRYPLTQDDPPLRNHNDYLRDVGEAERSGSKVIRGVKGRSALTKLRFFDCIWGYPLDDLHGIFWGGVRQIWEILTQPGSWCVLPASKRRIVEDRLLNIKPPQEIHRLPRSLLKDRARWKAAEWRSWLLFYSYPCLVGILNDERLLSLTLLIRTAYSLLGTEIPEDVLWQCTIDMIRFVGECEIFYGKGAMTFNLHSLVHVVQSVRQSGPLWAASTLPFESGIFHLKQLVSGPKGTSSQIANKTLQMIAFKSQLANTSGTGVCSIYCETLFNRRRLSTNHVKTSSGVLLIGEVPELENNETYLKPSTTNNLNLPEGKVFNRCIYRDTVFRSALYNRPKKTKDTVVQLTSNAVVEILNFVLVGEECYIRVCELVLACVLPASERFHIKKVTGKLDRCDVVPIANIKCKVIFMDVKHASFVCISPNTFECS